MKVAEKFVKLNSAGNMKYFERRSNLFRMFEESCNKRSKILRRK